MSKDYYERLGVKKDASQEELKKQFRKLSLKYHPDRQQGKSESEKKEAEENFKSIAEAYSTLSDPEKRKKYDMFGPEGMNQQGGGFGANFDPREFFRRHMSGFGSHFGFGDFDGFPGFGFGGGMDSEGVDSNAPEDGRTIKLRASLPFEDMIYGTKKTFDISVEDVCSHCKGTGSEDGKNTSCPHCGGSGMLTQRHGMMIMQSTCPHCHGAGHVISNPCHVCNGSGRAPSKRHLEVEIPRGINEGESVIVHGVGLTGKNGGKNGDVVIVLSQEKHDIFERDGLDLLTRVTIPSITAILGGDVEIYTPWGKTNTNIPHGTNNGKTLKLSGFGVRRGNSNGDLYVVLEVESMTNLTEEQKKVLNTLKNLSTKKNYPKVEEKTRKCEEFEEKTKSRR